MIKKIGISILVFTLLSLNLKGTENEKIKNDTLKRKWYIPRAAKIQHAGNIGFMSLGATYYLVDDWYQLSIMYGMATDHTDAKTLNTLAFKNTFHIKKFYYKDFILSPMAGLSINLGSTHNTYRKLPDYFPDKYYFQNKIHFAPFVGATIYHPLPYKTIKGIDFYFEMGTMDNYLLEAIRTDYVKYSDIWNLALGLSFYF
ncbi:hypothetical protein EO244_14285 [Ancylomarina salipaludis]|uniref:Outer membrane protein beta-barrel domain-containing protein n=1 Tax=Ancylomarina salipaludis TaxID=2501299 RepID=A0A4V1MZU6_9BACT|nr:hypothetical protein [Ancylomarina salipaludis]RXQ89531.1 hypothetical protein EO244_14285 [Ancylomarina salipaludis]